MLCVGYYTKHGLLHPLHGLVFDCRVYYYSRTLDVRPSRLAAADAHINFLCSSATLLVSRVGKVLSSHVSCRVLSMLKTLCTKPGF